MAELARYTLFLDADSPEWVLKRVGALRALRRFRKKREAVQYLPTRFGDSYPASVKIEREDGTFEEERIYPMDLRETKG